MTDLKKQRNLINKLQQTHIQKQKIIMWTIIIYGEKAQIYQMLAAIHHHPIYRTVPFINFLETYINLPKPDTSEIRRCTRRPLKGPSLKPDESLAVWASRCCYW
jgi:hypothetical protein